MLSSLFTGITGLSSQSKAMGVISDNIANINTVGFKSSRFSFADILSASIGGATNVQVGGGVRLSSVLPNFIEGSIVTTGNPTDLAIDGNGFFIVSDGSGNFYTRAGQFVQNGDGELTTPEGYVLQGWNLEDNSFGNINLSNVICPPKATEKVELKLNLCSEAEVPPTPFDATDISSDMYNYSTSVTVYDSEGSSHEVTIYFVKTGDNAWEAHYVYTQADGTVAEAGTQSLTFNDGSDPSKPAGSLSDDSDDTAISFDFGDITFDYGTGTDETPAGDGLDGTTLSSAACTLNSVTQDGYGAAGDGLDGTTQFCSACTLNSLTQDGYGAGSLKNISIDEQGVISGIFSNGELKELYQIALASFSAPCYLQKMGDNLYEITGKSGQPIIGKPNTGDKGKIVAGSLEQSNVDIAKEFTNMILVQRAFQANSKVITTSDIMLDDLIRMKR